LLCAPHIAAAELPAPVRAIIDAAIATGDAGKVATVVELAKVTNPEDIAEVDQIVAGFALEQDMLAASDALKKEDAIRAAGLFDNWSGKGEIGAFRYTGNSSNTGITADLKLDRIGIDWRHKFRALVDFQRSNGVTTREQFLVAYEPNYALSDRSFIYGLAQYERDRFQGYSARYSLSGGAGYRVIDLDDMHLSVKAGLAYRKTEFLTGISDDNVAALAALDFDFSLSERLKLTQEASAYFQSGTVPTSPPQELRQAWATAWWHACPTQPNTIQIRQSELCKLTHSAALYQPALITTHVPIGADLWS